MANNIDFISSIKNEKDFEELIRLVAKHIYDAEAYLTGGPYDGGRDLIYKVLGREVKEAVQISIQKKDIESKLIEDAIKTKKLVAEHQYPNRLTFFWSQTASASRKLNLKKSVRNQTGVELEIYDASEIDQIISDDAPEILRFLLEQIHKYSFSDSQDVDVKARTFYDYLALSKDATELKTSIIDAQILSDLLGGRRSRSSLIEELEAINIKPGVAASRISYLVKVGRVEESGDDLSLSDKENVRILNIVGQDKSQRSSLLGELKEFTEREIGEDLSEKALELIKRVYSASVDVQLSEITFQPPKLSIAKNIVHELEALIISAKPMGSDEARALAKHLIELASCNDYLSNYSSSLLCINLLNQKRLEKYIREKVFFIYLDAPVFIRYIALFRFKETVNSEKEMHVVAHLRDAMKGVKADVRVTREHLEETIRHITQAEKISSFANDTLIEKFGDSKNVYFNLYLREKRNKNRGYSFDNFLSDLIGFDADLPHGSRFDAYLQCAQRFMKMAGISVESLPDADVLEEDVTARRILGKYIARTEQMGKVRKVRTALNDVICCYILSDDYRHVDDTGVGHTPIIVTWDSTQHELRSIYCAEFPHNEWIVYSPQRALERFSMLHFNMKGNVLKDNVLAILDEDYIRDSSLIDTLAIFLGDDQVETDAIISVLTKLSGKTNIEASEPHQFDIDGKNSLNEALLHLQNAFRTRFSDVRRLFTDKANEEPLIEVLADYVSGKLNSEAITVAIGNLLDSPAV